MNVTSPGALQRDVEGHFPVGSALNNPRGESGTVPAPCAAIEDHDRAALLRRSSKKDWRIRASDAASSKTPAPATLGVLHARAGQQLAPAAGGFRVGDIDGLRVEREPLRVTIQRRGCEARAVVDLQQQVLASLGWHFFHSLFASFPGRSAARGYACCAADHRDPLSRE